jgi:hypothetical protein
MSVAVCLSLALTISGFAQTSSSNPQALTLLQKSLAVLIGPAALTDVTLAGAVRRIVGSDDESGTATLKALASGAARTDLNFSSGQLAEVIDLSTAPAGAWLGPDRNPHPMAFHNLISEPAWFFPAFAVSRRLTASGYVVTYVGHETHNGQAVEHVTVYQAAPLPNPPGGATFEHLTQTDFFLDSSTTLPAALEFNLHPDNNALVDIPVEVQFTDYRPVNGAQVPFHVQKFLNNTLILDFQVQTVTFNTGFPAGTFTAQ